MILFIDTHDSLITIGLKINDEIYIKTKESEFSHSIYTLPLIKELFEEHKANYNDIKSIVVVNGPGSFTGIRIGLSIAKTMAYCLNTKINTISSLKAYLISSEHENDKICVIPDNKGYYICALDKDNNEIIAEQYTSTLNYSYYEVPHKLNIEKILNYFICKDGENPHHIKANYVKKIEVEK